MSELDTFWNHCRSFALASIAAVMASSPPKASPFSESSGWMLWRYRANASAPAATGAAKPAVIDTQPARKPTDG